MRPPAPTLQSIPMPRCEPVSAQTLYIWRIMRPAFFTILTALFVGCATSPGPVDQLVADLSSSHGHWENGTYPVLGLPGTASPEQVVKGVFDMTSFDAGHIASYRIIEIRPVYIQGSVPAAYTAALVQTDLGEKIVLFDYVGPKVGWLSRVYASNRAHNQTP